MDKAGRKRPLRAIALLGACSCGVVAPSSSRQRRTAATAFAPSHPSPRHNRPPRPYASASTASSWSLLGGQRRDSTAMNLRAVGLKRPRSETMKELHDDGGPFAATNNATKSKPRIEFDILPDFMQKDPLAVTKQRWLERTNPPAPEEDDEGGPRRGEMMAMSVVAVALSVAVVYALASSTPEMIAGVQDDVKGFGPAVASGGQRNVEQLELATRNIVGTVLPQSAEDVIAVSIGEGIAGVIGAFATWLLGLVLNFKSDENYVVSSITSSSAGAGAGGGGRGPSGSSGGRGDYDALVSEAVADGDYFLTRAAAEPLLEAAGIPLFAASLASVLIATLPYEAVKLTSQKRRTEMEEERLLEMLLEEEERRREDMTAVDVVGNNVADFIGRFTGRLYVRRTDDDFVEDDAEEDVDGLEALKSQARAVSGLDYIELFADITKWLEYDVLITNYRGVLELPTGQALSSGWESAIFGLLAALSSQLYTDVLYLYSDFGNPEKRDRTINRPVNQWASVYTAKCVSTATLFGTYEAAREPASRFVRQLISGGVGECRGSNNYDLCMETFLIDNPPGATIEAQFRALSVSIMNWVDSPLSILLPLNDQETFGNFVRAEVVSLYSLLARIFNVG